MARTRITTDKSNVMDSQPMNITDYESKENGDTGEKQVYALVANTELIDMIDYIRHYFQIVNDTELLRICISLTYHQIEPKRTVKA